LILCEFETDENKKTIMENLNNIFKGYPTEIVESTKNLITNIGNKGK
jgi:hypothetical protein